MDSSGSHINVIWEKKKDLAVGSGHYMQRISANYAGSHEQALLMDITYGKYYTMKGLLYSELPRHISH